MGRKWQIHNVGDMNSVYKGSIYLGNFHTHGLYEEYGQKELCLVLNLPPETACGLLNSMGDRVASGSTIFTEGIRTDILVNNMDVQLLSLENDPTLYVILPDKNGKLPMDTDCKEPYKYQYEYAQLLSENQEYV